MNCVLCGRPKGLLERFEKYGFCPQCYQLTRQRIKNGLAQLRDTAMLCDARLERWNKGGGMEEKDAFLQSQMDKALELAEDLEDFRSISPFFKTPTDDLTRRITACRQALAQGTPPRPGPGESAQAPRLDDPPLAAGDQAQAAFLSLLEGIPSAPLPLYQYEELPARRRPCLPEGVACGRIARNTPAHKLGRYVALDVKATCASPRRAEPVELSAIRFEDFRPVAMLSTLLVPRHPIPAQAERALGITNEMVRGMPLIDEVMPAFREFTKGAGLVGHGLLSDLALLYVYGFDPLQEGRRFYDTGLLAREQLAAPAGLLTRKDGDASCDVADYRLKTLCGYFSLGLPEQYRQGAHCLAAGLLFGQLARRRVGQAGECPGSGQL